jgi:type III secretion protein C
VRYARAKIISRTARMLGAGGVAAVLATAFTLAPAPAAPLKLPDGVYKYTVIDQDIVGALQAFGSNLSLKINISPEVNGRIQGKWPEVSPRKFLDWLSGQGNFEWYFDGLVLHISAVKEAQTRFFVLPPISLDQFQRALDALGVSDDRYAVQSAPGDALVKVAGPPRFVALAEQTLTGLTAEARTRPKPDRPKVQNPAKVAEERTRPKPDRPKVQNPPKIAEERMRLKPDRPTVQSPPRVDSDSSRLPTPRPPIADSGSRPTAARVPSALSCQDCGAPQPFPPYPRPPAEARNGNAARRSCQDCRALQPFPPYPHPHVEALHGNTAHEQDYHGRADGWQLQSPGRTWLPRATR